MATDLQASVATMTLCMHQHHIQNVQHAHTDESCHMTVGRLECVTAAYHHAFDDADLRTEASNWPA